MWRNGFANVRQRVQQDDVISYNVVVFSSRDLFPFSLSSTRVNPNGPTAKPIDDWRPAIPFGQVRETRSKIT